MPAWAWIVVVVAVVVVAALVWAMLMRQRSARLRSTFGPEYDRTLDASGGRRREAESDLRARRDRREQLDIRPLNPASRERYLNAWRQTQERFVDAPSEAVAEADRLVTDVMRERGYPMENFEQRAADISVDHPNVVNDYREAHAVSVANANGEADTEELRRAFVHYRSLFEDLLEPGDAAQEVREAR
jgi:hypothetical protein